MRVFFLLFAGCQPRSRWLDTSEACGFPSAPIDLSSFLTPPAYPSEGCVDAVLEDFGGEQDALLAADGLSDPYGLVYGEPIEASAIGRLLWAAHALLAHDLGDLSDLSGSYGPLLSGLGEQGPVQMALYDYVTERVSSTTPGTRSDAAAGIRGGQLILYDLPAGIDGAAVLVHEARHRDGRDHVLCGSAPMEPICDVGFEGSWGFELGVHELARDRSADVLAREIEQSWLDALPERILF